MCNAMVFPKGKELNEVSYSYREAIVDALKLKMKYALKEAQALTGSEDVTCCCRRRGGL